MCRKLKAHGMTPRPSSCWVDNIIPTSSKDYLATTKQQPNRVCVVMFALTRKEAEKKFIKLRKEYTVKAKGKYDVRYLTNTDFKFQPVDMSDQ